MKLPGLSENYDRQTNPRTDTQAQREVSLIIIYKGFKYV